MHSHFLQFNTLAPNGYHLRKAAVHKDTQFYALALISHHMHKFAIIKALCISPEQSPFVQV
jgi:hypothetical protein